LFSVGKKSEIGTEKPGTAAKLLHQYMQMKMSASSIPRLSGDQLNKYFQSIEATVRTLPVNIQIKFKSQISQMVYNAYKSSTISIRSAAQHCSTASLSDKAYPIQQQTNPVQQQSNPVQQSYVAFQPQYTDLS